VQIELGERLAEVELAREAEAVHRACAVLAEIDLVDVRGHEVVFVIAQLERDRHERLAQLARPAALVAQEVAAHELLRERARTLADLARRKIYQRSAQHSEHVDAVVLRRSAGPRPPSGPPARAAESRPARRSAGPRRAREQAADQERIEARYTELAAARVAQRADALIRERQRRESCGLGVTREVEAASRDLHAAEADAIGAGPASRGSSR
jgi:hypothetical protein